MEYSRRSSGLLCPVPWSVPMPPVRWSVLSDAGRPARRRPSFQKRFAILIGLRFLIAAICWPLLYLGNGPHQTRQASARTIGWPCLHENACQHSVIFDTTLLTRNSGSECGLVVIPVRASSGRMLVHQE